MGPDCYKDKDRFPSGPWCSEGDFVLVRPHAGTRIKIHNKEFRIINDDSVEGVVEDPRGISRSQERVIAEAEKKEVEQEEPDFEIEGEEPEVELKVEDDTPKEDRNRSPMPKEIVEDLEKDELENYSDGVKERLKQMKKVWHDERRAKESAQREHQQAIEMAKKALAENKRLQEEAKKGREAYLNSAKKSVEYETEMAKRAYKDAYESGDTDSIVEAQTKLSEANYKRQQIENYVPPRQEEENSVNSRAVSGYWNENPVATLEKSKKGKKGKKGKEGKIPDSSKKNTIIISRATLKDDGQYNTESGDIVLDKAYVNEDVAQANVVFKQENIRRRIRTNGKMKTEILAFNMVLLRKKLNMFYHHQLSQILFQILNQLIIRNQYQY